MANFFPISVFMFSMHRLPYMQDDDEIVLAKVTKSFVSYECAKLASFILLKANWPKEI